MLCFLGLHNIIWKNVKHIGVIHTKFQVVVTSGWEGGRCKMEGVHGKTQLYCYVFLGWAVHT